MSEVSEEEQAAQRVMGYVHPYIVTSVAFICIAAGFIFGWWTTGLEGHSGIGFIIAAILVVAVRFPVKLWQTWAAEKDDDQVIKEVEKLLKVTEKSTDGAVRSAAFDPDDFDVATKSILIKAVKKARRQKVPVGVPFLLQELSKSIR